MMADYYCYPLWHAGGDEVGNIDPRELPISRVLANELISWSDIYDGTLNMSDPTGSGFKSKDDDINFKKAGEALYQKLKVELGCDYDVSIRL